MQAAVVSGRGFHAQCSILAGLGLLLLLAIAGLLAKPPLFFLASGSSRGICGRERGRVFFFFLEGVCLGYGAQGWWWW